MPGFCVSCGAPLTGAFCNKCGARAAASSSPIQASPPMQSAAVSQPAATAAKGSGIGKLLLWAGGILLVLFVAGGAAAVYGVYWVKHKVSTYTAAVTGGSSEPVKVVQNGNSCRLLSTAELQQILGVTVERSAEIVDEGKPGCAYYTNQEAFNQLQRQAAALAKKQADEVNNRPGPKPDNLPALMKNANELEGIVKTLAMTQPVEGGQLFSFTVEHNADPNAWLGARTVQAAVPGYEEVSGVGDHAMMGAFGHLFLVQKGDAFIYLNTLWIPDARTRGSEIAKTIMGHL